MNRIILNRIFSSEIKFANGINRKGTSRNGPDQEGGILGLKTLRSMPDWSLCCSVMFFCVIITFMMYLCIFYQYVF